MTENPDSKTTEETKPRRTSREPKPYSKHLSDQIARNSKRSPRRNNKKQNQIFVDSDESDEEMDSELDLSANESEIIEKGVKRAIN
jgi:hypothetical protein